MPNTPPPVSDLSAAEREAKAFAHFEEYFVRNYPGPETIIGNPKWHAPKIWRAAQYAMSLAAPPRGGETADLRALLEKRLADTYPWVGEGRGSRVSTDTTLSRGVQSESPSTGPTPARPPYTTPRPEPESTPPIAWLTIAPEHRQMAETCRDSWGAAWYAEATALREQLRILRINHDDALSDGVKWQEIQEEKVTALRDERDGLRADIVRTESALREAAKRLDASESRCTRLGEVAEEALTKWRLYDDAENNGPIAVRNALRSKLKAALSDGGTA